MKDKRHLIVVDPTAFSGGSKVATESILALLDINKIRITVLTADKQSWQGLNVKRVQLFEPKWLAAKEQGIFYFVRHLCIAFNLLLVSLRYGRFDVALGASGPGVDLALYLLRPIMKYKVIQLIHGPVAKSRTIARCLLAAQKVYYLPTCYDSLQSALCKLPSYKGQLPLNFHSFQNGLSEKNWPTRCQQHTTSYFWAASLLKWKGLDTFLTSLSSISASQRPRTHICYIKPKGLQLPMTKAPILIAKVNWHNEPKNLDQLRANSNIFISTSHKEPFGLSILEAMAAGQCVVIPADGAYWDQVLLDNINCIKYTPNNSVSLAEKLLMLKDNPPLINRLGDQASLLAEDYQAQKKYKHIVNELITCAELPNNKADLARSMT